MRVLAYTSPARGHLYPVTPIMAELAARGHDAYLCGLADELPQLQRLGIECAPIDPAVAEIEIEGLAGALPARSWPVSAEHIRAALPI